ncbi:3-hydroxyacyl-CoA dehydrogenase family protein [Nesterenkonia sedimenti]|uniref:3-hydroxyacyl-CoA dehydrogenase family protein n=1 Tax=Nesterenkonia sedimenti TaxID=1463632 RepID=UPI002277271C|nr:3-hydroxyacyl-CoA dehydrogenase family protein [Nesterenkonia sedimenti]
MTETQSTTASEINRVSVIGAGTMGAQIAMVAALAGFSTDLIDIKEQQLEQARTSLAKRLDRDVQKGRRSQDEVDATWDRMNLTTDRDAAVKQSDFVIEAAVEDLGIKKSLFSELDELCPPHTILATNSSNIVSSRIAEATNRPEKVCNMHFFNPALVMKCVEVVPNPQTSSETVATTTALAEAMGKDPVQLHKEVPGFVANRLLNALRKEALDLYNKGIVDFQDIDTAAKTALGHPMGPFELMDLVGIDVVYLIRLAEYEQTGDPASLPDPAVKELYEAGRYGRKSGHGWYSYES